MPVAVKVEGGALRVDRSKLPCCPLCREHLVWVHRSRGEATFYLISKRHCMMEIARINERALAPRLRISKGSYTNNSIAI